MSNAPATLSPSDARPGVDRHRLAPILVPPSVLLATLRGVRWAVRGCSGFACLAGCVFTGMAWGHVAPDRDETIPALVRSVAGSERHPTLGDHSRPRDEMVRGPDMPDHRRHLCVKPISRYWDWVKPFVLYGSVVVPHDRFDDGLRGLPDWIEDHHPNLAGTRPVGEESIRSVASLIRGEEDAGASASPPGLAEATKTSLEFIDTGFENASPLWYEAKSDGTIGVHLVYDHERSSPNRAAGHFHFRLHAPIGSTLTLEFRNLDNVWNGRKASVADELKAAVISEDGKVWKSVPLERRAGDRVRLTVVMPGPSLYVARVEPYRLSDLERWLKSIEANPLVKITAIGKTVEGRELEVVRIGREDAPYRVFLRARAHAWEPGGNWVVQGLTDRLLRGDDEAKRYLERYCVYVLPMANKDGVARGRTRFNLRGKDLNRGWDRPADPWLAPENHALEVWLEEMIARGQRPHLALELHNDGSGQLHISRAPVADLDRHLARMKTLEAQLREHTWFTEGSTKGEFRNSGTLGEGWLQRYGIDAAVHELNANWIAGLKDYPSSKHWQTYGGQLARVFDEYFETVKP